MLLMLASCKASLNASLCLRVIGSPGCVAMASRHLWPGLLLEHVLQDSLEEEVQLCVDV